MGIGLTVDWDFFMDWTPNNAEYTDYHQLYAWAYRNPLQARDDELIHTFWDRLRALGFTFERPRLLVCDNHGHAYKFFSKERYVVSFDAHTDCYDSPITGEVVTCGNWLHRWAEDYQRTAMVVLPGHIDWRHVRGSKQAFVTNWRRFTNHTYKDQGPVSRIVICRSSPWTHPLHDGPFVQFCEGLEGGAAGISIFDSTWIEDVKHDRPFMKLSPESLVGSIDETDWFGAITTSVAPRRLIRRRTGRLTTRRTTR